MRLLDVGFFRIGTEGYAEQNESYGLATMRKEHVSVDGDEVTFDYVAKSGKQRIQSVVDPAVHAIVCELKRRRAGGPELLAYRDGRRWVDVKSTDINDYIKEITGADFTAKDFRTWNATVLAAVAMAVSAAAATSATARKRAVARAMKEVSHYLGNTPAVCRSSYVDPEWSTATRRAPPSPRCWASWVRAPSSASCRLRRGPSSGPLLGAGLDLLGFGQPRVRRGGVTFASDARSLGEILAMYEADGFTEQFGARPGGRIVCFSCHFEGPAEEFALESLSRTEGASDPDDMLVVAALRCRKCRVKGTLVMSYGPEITEDDADVLRRLDDLDKRRENPTS